MMTQQAPAMPVSVGVQFAHAVVQAVAEDNQIQVLHIKGPAIHPRLRARDVSGEITPRKSMDADIWVHPGQVAALFAAMERHGWRLKVPFGDGSAFEHAATLVHPSLAPVDVHRGFPGINADPAEVFQLLWNDRDAHHIAGQRCWVPSVTAQRMILILNAARSRVAGNADIAVAWSEATTVDRNEVQALATDMQAEVALAAGTGRLDNYRDRRDYPLWWLLSTGNATPISLWLARVRAEPTLLLAVRRAVKLVFPSPRRMALQAGRRLSRWQLLGAYVRTGRRAASQVGLLVQRNVPVTAQRMSRSDRS